MKKGGMVTTSDRRRLVAIFFFQLFLFSVLIGQFYRIQIIQGEKWEEKALAQHQKFVIEPFKRGSFYSNTSLKIGHSETNQPFVLDVAKFHLYVDPDNIPNRLKEEMILNLFTLLDPTTKKKIKIYKDFYKKSRSRKIFSYIEREKLDQILQWWNEFSTKEKIAKNLLYYTQDYKRSYPFNASLGQVLHTVLEQKDPKSKQALPTGGLEMYFNHLLKGREGKKIITCSALHTLDTKERIEERQDGADIHLTINHYLQAIAEDELEKGVQNAKAKGGWAVMMDPYTGHIYALAHYPLFDLTKYQTYFNDPSLQSITRAKAVTDSFEPASIFKPIILAIALKANEELIRQNKEPIFTPDEKISTLNGHFPGRSFPLKDATEHQFLNMSMAVQKSANIYMGKIMQRLVEKMGDKWIRNALFEFGFGQKTAVEMPAESPGLLPTPLKLHPNGTLEWSKPTPYSLAIGHNVLVNTMQIVRAYAMIANGGFKVRPTLIRKIVKKNGEEENIFLDNTVQNPDSHKERFLKETVTQPLKRALQYVTKVGGTGKRAEIEGYSEAGKTGTSEKIIDGKYSHSNYISSFVGFAPVEKPRFVLMVVIDEPEVKYIPGVGKNYSGGVCAAPVFSKIAKRTLNYLGIAPDDPYGYSSDDPRRDVTKAHWQRQVEELKNLYQKWNVK